jgi:hypothetical protein
MKKELFEIAYLIRLCERKMSGKYSRLPRKTKKLVKRYMLLVGLDSIILGGKRKQNVFMREDGTIFTTKTLLPL